jgi:hypothetical protein
MQNNVEHHGRTFATFSTLPPFFLFRVFLLCLVLLLGTNHCKFLLIFVLSQIVEKILSLLTDPVNQRRIAQVCLLWHDLVERLRYVVFISVVV